MFPSGNRYPRLLPPAFLSPINESEEETQHLQVKSDSFIAEVNNSSVIPKQISETTCTSDGTTCGSEDVETPKFEKVVIESCSGRKLEDVEVLKQKYINNEIQDLPRFLAGSIGHNRIWRIRRTNLNLGSQDIRNQLGKLHLNLGTSSNHVDREKQIEYRYKKYNSPREHSDNIRKSAEELYYSDFYQTDDYDPELAALFENYIEECDNVTKKHFSEFPTVSDSEHENILSKYQMDQDSEHAFMLGFIEGMRQIDNANKFSHEGEEAVHGSELLDNAVKGMASYRDLICSKQDVTHMSLREWENVHRSEQEQKDRKRQKLMKIGGSKQGTHLKHVRCHDDNTVAVNEVKTDSTEDAGDSCKDSVIFAEAIHALKTMTRSKATVNENNRIMTGNEKIPEAEVKKNETLHDESQKLKAVRSCLEDSIPCRYSNKHLSATLNRVKLTPSMREKSVNENKYRVVDIKHLTDEDNNIVKLAKKKLEHSMFSSQALEDTYLSMVRARMIANDCKPEGVRKLKNDLKGNKTNDPKVEAKGMVIPFDLDGWTTENKTFIDQESAQVSSSEILHPVDSFEMISTPMWTPPSTRTPHFPSIGKQTPTCINDTPSKLWDCETSTVNHAVSSDKEKVANGSKPEVRKPSKSKQLGVMGDYKKAAKLVKLRLTKSNDSVGSNAVTPLDKSFANVPLSQCASYNIEQNLKSNTMLTTNINLSERLAQQLKDLSNDRKMSIFKNRENKPKVSSDQSQISKLKTESNVLPPLSGSSLNVDRTLSIKVTSDNEGGVSKNHTHSPTELGPIIPRQLGREHNVLDLDSSASQSLPNLSVTSIYSRIPPESNKNLSKILEDKEDASNRGAAVRAGTCTSPYTFDKGDPQLLQLKAKPLPHLHKVCTSCGGISESQENSKGKQKRKSKRKEKCTKNIAGDKSCCKTYVEDKWKLDEKRSRSFKVSSNGIGKHSRVLNNDASQDKDLPPKPSLMFSPTSKQKCEEMSINFMNKSLKFRFQCDVSVESKDQNADEEGDKTDKWLNNISTPSCKERFQCPVATETRIYKDSLRRSSSDRGETTPQAPVTSPYLEYCKVKADKIAKRREALCETSEYLSDTCLTKDMYMKAAKKAKRFPVIPMKKSRDSPRVVKVQSSSRNSGSRPNSNCDLFIKSTKPARLPCMKTLPYDISSENVNNNVYPCSYNRSHESIAPETFGRFPNNSNRL